MIMPHFCNPVDCVYPYQFISNPHTGEITVNREAADPSVIFFKGKYYLFASMTLSVWVSEDLAHWESHKLPKSLPLYDYAPDVCAAGDWVYFSASDYNSDRSFYRTKDVLNGPYEEIKTAMRFHDPHLYADEDGRMYFYWGCSDETPIYGVELAPETMQPLGKPVPLISGDPYTKGYERIGDDNAQLPATEEEIEAILRAKGMLDAPPELQRIARGILGRRPYIEGPWMTKYQGKYYLQYATPGTEYNVYGDSVYVGNSPLGPFALAENNPYSFQPGGFFTGAGHGSTFQDEFGNWWHASTMRISINHNFERRVGIWPAGFDAGGGLFCNNRYGDWPRPAPMAKLDPWTKPEWMLLSYGKGTTASSGESEKAVDEDVRTWWRAETSNKDEWLTVDMGKVYDVRAVQVNFADDKEEKAAHTPARGERYIEEKAQRTRYLLEGSADGVTWSVLSDRRDAWEDRPHETHFLSEKLRYVRVSRIEMPYGRKPCISGLRVFGMGSGSAPEVPAYEARADGMDLYVSVSGNAVGYNILWGHAEDKLYHSCILYGTEKRIGALVKGQCCYVRVDAFNENGITEGMTRQVV